jgi:N-methylhydantoinase A
MFLSGPAAGVAGAAFVARHCGAANLITMDIGGTSCDIALVVGGQPQMVAKGLSEYRIDGNPINIRMMDITTIGAGGGSIAWIDDGGMLRVGPQSAGAQPGPACYGRGGTDFTLTDALVLLGLMDPARFMGGEMRIDPALSLRATEALGARLGMDSIALARSIFRIAVVNIAQAIRQTTVQRGRDPRDFAILPYGGGGALFAASVAEAMGIDRVVVPPNPGIFSAYGLTVSDVRLDYTRSDPGRRLAQMTTAEIEAEFAALATQAHDEFRGFGIEPATIRLTRLIDARYVGQGFELTVTVAPAALAAQGPAAVAEAFHAAHAARYGYAFAAQQVEIVGYRLEASVPQAGRLPQPDATAPPAAAAQRQVRLDGEDEWAAHERAALPAGTLIDGPAIIFEATSSTTLPRHWQLEVDHHGNLLLTRQHSDGQGAA